MKETDHLHAEARLRARAEDRRVRIKPDLTRPSNVREIHVSYAANE